MPPAARIASSFAAPPPRRLKPDRFNRGSVVTGLRDRALGDRHWGSRTFRLPLFHSLDVEEVCMEQRYRALPRIRIEVVHDSTVPSPRIAIRGPADVFRLLGAEARTWDRERFLCVLVDGRHRLIGIDEVSSGTLTASLVHPREIFKAAILANTCAIILVHNHPSGDPTPSQEDREITTRLRDAARILGIPILDHIVLGHNDWRSLAESEPGWQR